MWSDLVAAVTDISNVSIGFFAAVITLIVLAVVAGHVVKTIRENN